MYMNNIDFMKSNISSPLHRVAVPLYYADGVNHCPSCGHSHWHIGRTSAECAFCNDAIPLAQTNFPPISGLVPMEESLSL